MHPGKSPRREGKMRTNFHGTARVAYHEGKAYHIRFRCCGPIDVPFKLA
jgi:hypothetical protein